MDLDHRKYQSGKKRGLTLGDLELYQNWLENELVYEVKEISLDEYWFCVNGKLYARYFNCSGVSEAFLKHCFLWHIAFILDDGYDESQPAEEIDAEEALEEEIRENLWDWKEEVVERKRHKEISIDIEKMKKEAMEELRKM